MRLLAASANAALLDDDDRRHLLDREASREVRPPLGVDVVDEERRVVSPLLEDLSKEAFDASGEPGCLRTEHQQGRTAHRPWNGVVLRLMYRRRDAHVAPLIESRRSSPVTSKALIGVWAPTRMRNAPP